MKISVIVPVFNEEKFILETLKKVNLQKKNYNLEIIVIDDCSIDETCKKLKKMLTFTIILLRMKKI